MTQEPTAPPSPRIVSPYRISREPEPPPPDPEIDRYAAQAMTRRRRVIAAVVGVALAGALMLAVVLALRARRERRLRELWQDALACFDDGTPGFARRVRARQLAAFNGEERASTWPSRCDEPLRAFARVADEAGYRPLSSSARDLAHAVEGRDLTNVSAESLAVEAARMMANARDVGLGPTAAAPSVPRRPSAPAIDELESLPPDRVCVFADDSRRATCGRSARSDDVRIFDGTAVGFAFADRRGASPIQPMIRAPRVDEVKVEACDQAGCSLENAGIDWRPAFLTTAWCGRKLAVVWLGDGIRMRFAERARLAQASTRVILDDWSSGSTEATESEHVLTAKTPIQGMRLVGRGDHALLFIKAAAVFVARIDEDGKLSPVQVAERPSESTTEAP